MREFLLNSPLKLVVFASGNGSNFEAIQEAIVTKKLNAEIQCLVTDKAKAYARIRAQKHNIKEHNFIFTKDKGKEAYEQEIIDALENYEFDYIVCAGYMRIIGPTLLNKYQGKIINIHPSDLPKYKGINALKQALDAGEKEIGVSVHYIDETLDGGEIIEQMVFPITESMSQEAIEERLHKEEHILYVKVLQQLKGEK